VWEWRRWPSPNLQPGTKVRNRKNARRRFPGPCPLKPPEPLQCKHCLRNIFTLPLPSNNCRTRGYVKYYGGLQMQTHAVGIFLVFLNSESQANTDMNTNTIYIRTWTLTQHWQTVSGADVSHDISCGCILMTHLHDNHTDTWLNISSWHHLHISMINQDDISAWYLITTCHHDVPLWWIMLINQGEISSILHEAQQTWYILTKHHYNMTCHHHLPTPKEKIHLSQTSNTTTQHPNTERRAHPNTKPNMVRNQTPNKTTNMNICFANSIVTNYPSETLTRSVFSISSLATLA